MLPKALKWWKEEYSMLSWHEKLYKKGQFLTKVRDTRPVSIAAQGWVGVHSCWLHRPISSTQSWTGPVWWKQTKQGFLQKHLLVTKNSVFRGSVQTYSRTAWDWSEKLSMQQLGLPTESQTPVWQWLKNVLLTSRIPLRLKKFMVPRKFIVVDLPKCCFCLHDKRSVQKKL